MHTLYLSIHFKVLNVVRRDYVHEIMYKRLWLIYTICCQISFKVKKLFPHYWLGISEESNFPISYWTTFLSLKGEFGEDTDWLYFKYLFLNSTGYPVIPKYYYVPADFVEHEKRNPGSQKRFPSNCGRDGKLFLWGQALYIIAKLLGKWRRLGILCFFPYCQVFRNKYVFVGVCFGFGWWFMLSRGLEGFFFFNWWKIALQCCVGFCCTIQMGLNYIWR